jgi:hypothetical protein
MSDGGCFSVKHAILDLSFLAVDFWADGDALPHPHSVYGVAKKILEHLLGLLTLQIRLSCRTEPLGYLYEYMEGDRLKTGYGELTGFLESTSAETVTIDATKVDWAAHRASIEENAVFSLPRDFSAT